MLKKMVILLIVLGLLTGCGAAGTGESKKEEDHNWVKVKRVVDGDTFEIVNRGKIEKVRLIGVDTPETLKPNSEVEPYGPEASSFTKKMIEGKKVRLEFDVQERDRYGRILAYVYLENGAFLNARLLEEGLATTMTVPPNVRMAEHFLGLQKKAQKARKGIWEKMPFENR
ncbi:MAG: thermonuclease family protein [Bacillota bacterium]